MVVVAAGGVELGVAMGAARVGIEVSGDGESGAASAAEDGFVVPFECRPELNRMIRECDVAIFAGVEEAAAFHLDGDDVGGAVVVEAACLRVEVEAVDVGGGAHRCGSKRRAE